MGARKKAESKSKDKEKSISSIDQSAGAPVSKDVPRKVSSEVSASAEDKKNDLMDHPKFAKFKKERDS